MFWQKSLYIEMDSPIKNFYANKCVLITGGMGFIGKLMLAKLLRLNDVREVLLLSRPKGDKSNENRLKELFSGFLFKKFDEDSLKKVRLVNGDIASIDLKLSSYDREYIKENVQIILHSAAELNMDGSFKKSIATNVRGTKLLMDLGVESKNLISFVYISTAFSQNPQLHTKESFYEPGIDFRLAIKIVESSANEECLHVLTEKLIAPWQNIYSFSKAVTEDMVRHYQDRLPVVVARPSIGSY